MPRGPRGLVPKLPARQQYHQFPKGARLRQRPCREYFERLVNADEHPARCLPQTQNNLGSGARRGASSRRLGMGDQAFALSLFPGSLARTSDGFRLLAGLALGRFFIRLATLHLTKNALALQLLFEDPESLIDIVVANEYPQMFSDRATAVFVRGRDRE